jgi:hypothetical protein
MIGMFVATLPYHIQFDPHWSFDELVKHVKEKCIAIIEHSHYPLQHILADCHLNQSNIPFLETVFDFIIMSSDINQLSFDGASLEQVSLQQTSEVAKFDFNLTFFYNSISDNNRLSFSLVCSHDLYDETSVAKLAKRLQHLIEQIFSSTSSVFQIDQLMIPINKLSIILPEDIKEMQGVVFHRLSKINNEGMHMCDCYGILILVS